LEGRSEGLEGGAQRMAKVARVGEMAESNISPTTCGELHYTYLRNYFSLVSVVTLIRPSSAARPHLR